MRQDKLGRTKGETNRACSQNYAKRRIWGLLSIDESVQMSAEGSAQPTEDGVVLRNTLA